MDTETSTNSAGKLIKGLTPGQFLKLGRVDPCGSLEARRLASGATTFYWRVTLDGKGHRVIVGNYDAGAPPRSLTPTAKGYSIKAAVQAAQAMAQIHQDNLLAGGYLGVLAAEAEAAAATARAQAEELRLAEATATRAARFTLMKLLDAYCDYLQALGRSSYRNARSIFKLHVEKAHPDIASLPAKDVTAEQVADMMRKLVETGKGRTSNKLRSYMRSAYQVALAAKSKASIPVHFKGFAVTTNPAAGTLPDESQNKPAKHPLTVDELRIYWRAIKDMPGLQGAVLRLHLLTGGQRIEQLVRLRTADIGTDMITLYDGKGRPGKAPRPHAVPMIPTAAEALKACDPRGTYALSTDTDGVRRDGTQRAKGETHLANTGLSKWAAEAAQGIPGFKAKNIRSGVETLLASKRVPMEIRGRLQSHGISGVQSRHYDGHDYLDEKREALELLFDVLQQEPGADGARVVPLRPRARA